MLTALFRCFVKWQKVKPDLFFRNSTWSATERSPGVNPHFCIDRIVACWWFVLAHKSKWTGRKGKSDLSRLAFRLVFVHNRGFYTQMTEEPDGSDIYTSAFFVTTRRKPQAGWSVVVTLLILIHCRLCDSCRRLQRQIERNKKADLEKKERGRQARRQHWQIKIDTWQTEHRMRQNVRTKRTLQQWQLQWIVMFTIYNEV